MTGPFVELRGRGPGVHRVWVNMANVAWIHETVHGETTIVFTHAEGEDPKSVALGVDGRASDILTAAGLPSNTVTGTP